MFLNPVISCSRYDQTQTGDTNIHLQIKNVEVLALLDDAAPGEVTRDHHISLTAPHRPSARGDGQFG
jgi:hypothetical protein